MRLPRASHGSCIAAKSSGHGLMPTPSRSRLSLSTAMLAACFATSTAGRIASLMTNVVKRMRDVRAARNGISANGSMIGLSSRNARSPSAVYGYDVSESRGIDDAVGHDERVVARVLGRLGERREERGIAERLGVREPHGRIMTHAVRRPGGRRPDVGLAVDKNGYGNRRALTRRNEMANQETHYTDEAYDAVDDRPVVAATIAAVQSGAGDRADRRHRVHRARHRCGRARPGSTPTTSIRRFSACGGCRTAPLLGLIEIGFGVLMILPAVVPGGARELMGLLGAAALAFGIVTLVDAAQDDLHGWLGVTDRTGWFFIVVGAVVLLDRVVRTGVLPDDAPRARASGAPVDVLTAPGRCARTRGDRYALTRADPRALSRADRAR